MRKGGKQLKTVGKILISFLVIIQPICYLFFEITKKNMNNGSEYAASFGALCFIWLMLIQFAAIKSHILPAIGYLIIELVYNILFATVGQLVMYRWLENVYNYNSGNFLDVIVWCIQCCVFPCIVELIAVIVISIQRKGGENLED